MTVNLKEAGKNQSIQTLETILSGMDGIERALVDTEDGEVKIEYNENELSQEKIRNTILQNGFLLKE
ncbi:heavy-metal-associated domain-containing protein [Neobacillus bataviensis]|uniref:heavy-metal-associated domain-containing protein n=1 Tax=Neobacillus bataviensis TaxID=220685 RepID=UPI001CBCF876|nr:heavy-metal-associated domain-containing protein [Neobacillus bataviensis]